MPVNNFQDTDFLAGLIAAASGGFIHALHDNRNRSFLTVLLKTLTAGFAGYVMTLFLCDVEWMGMGMKGATTALSGWYATEVLEWLKNKIRTKLNVF
jgi:hypothetical protein